MDKHDDDCVEELLESRSAKARSRLNRFNGVIYLKAAFEGDEWTDEYIGKAGRGPLRYLEHRSQRAKWAFEGPERASVH